MNELSYSFAALAGLVSFLSPCVLPIVPGFLAYLAGSSSKQGNRRWDIFLSSLFFVLGFAAAFSILGVLLNTLLEAVAYDVQIWLSRLGGLLIIFFGLNLIGLIRIGFLEKEHRARVRHQFASRHLTSFVFGVAFAIGWTPCVGAVLGAILGLAATAPNAAFGLLFAYSMGFGVPFLIVGLLGTQANAFINRFAKYFRTINIGFGILLILIGSLIFTNKLSIISSFDALFLYIGNI
jgi:cytochrome c-type biogenesis protein